MQNKKVLNGRNAIIDILRFVFCLFIVNYHFFSHYLINIDFPNYFTRSYMADEFFFIVSGFYLAKAACQTEENPVLWNAKHSAKRIGKIAIPYYLSWIACFLGWRLTHSINGEPIGGLAHDIANSIYELLFLEILGFEKGLYSNYVGWFFSALLIVSFILGPWIAKYKQRFCLYCAPIIVVFSYSLLSLYFDYLYYPAKLIGDSFIKKGLVRAMAAVCVGVFLYGILQTDAVKVFFKRRKSKKVLLSITITDIALWLIIFSYMTYPYYSRSAETDIQFDYIFVFLLSTALIPVFGGLWQHRQLVGLDNIASILGKYAFYAYFGQAVFYSVDQIVYSLDIRIRYKAMILNLSVVFVTLLLWGITRTIKRLWSSWRAKVSI